MNANRSNFWSTLTPVARNVLIINFILWLASAVLPHILRNISPNFDLADWLGMHYWASPRFNVVQLFTYMFMHEDFSHFFFNMFAVIMFGVALEQIWGSKRFLLYYLITGVGAGIIQQLIWTIEYQPLLSALNDAIAANSGAELLPFERQLRRVLQFGNISAIDAPTLMKMKNLLLNHSITIGASGAVFGLLFAFGWLFPDAKLMCIFVPIPIRARIFVVIYAVIELFLGVANFTGDNIAHFAHLGGMLFGWLLILIWKKQLKNRAS